MAPKDASETTSGSGSSSKPAGTWDNIVLLNDLLVAFYQVGNQAGNFNPQVNEAVVAFLKAHGHETSWSAIRLTIWRHCYTPHSFLQASIASSKFIHFLQALLFPTTSATFYTLSIFTTLLISTNYLHHLHYLSTAIIFTTLTIFCKFIASYNISSPFQHHLSFPTNIIRSNKKWLLLAS
ncbi:hypothetical protein GGI35DRAFT_476619 [Trichoderma velutinum]